MRNFLFVIMSAMLSWSSCSNRSLMQAWKECSDSIVGVFYPGEWDPSISIPCSEAYPRIDRYAVDTVIAISAKEFAEIKSGIRKADVTSKKDTGNCRLKVKTDTLVFCICDFYKCYNTKDEEITVGKKTQYLIKCKVGYYNHIRREYLRYYREIRKFGIPSDYKYAYEKIKGIEQVLKKSHIIKVVLVKDDELGKTDKE